MSKANDCAAKTALYDSLNWCPGQKVLPGFRPRVYFVPIASVASFPKLKKITEATKMSELATYEGNYTLVADAKWQYIDCESVKANGSFESQGEQGGKTFIDKITVVYAGVDAAASALAAQLVNEKCIFLFQQRDGQFRVVGSEAFGGATVAPAGALGEGETGAVGTTFEVSGTTEVPMPFYPGEIDTDDGKISGADGSPVLPGG